MYLIKINCFKENLIKKYRIYNIMSQQQIIKECKHFIDTYNLDELKNLYNTLNETNLEYDINISFIFKEVFFYACKKNNKDIIDWLMSVYNNFDTVTKIALRQMFFYGKYILLKNKNSELIKWYEQNILEPIRS